MNKVNLFFLNSASPFFGSKNQTILRPNIFSHMMTLFFHKPETITCRILAAVICLAQIFISVSAFSQAPNLINYQAVALNTSGVPMANTTVKVKIGISTGNATTLSYNEERLVTTDASGLFNIQIGAPGALNVYGSLSSLQWNNQSKTLHIFIDPTGGTNFILMGTQQLVSVPYALHAKEAASLSSDAVVNLSSLSPVGATTRNVMQYDGSNWAPSTIENILIPFNDTDTSSTSFKITNTASNATAIHGKTTHTNPNSIGIYGEGSGGSSIGVRASNTSGFAVYATGTPTATYNPVIYGLSNASTGTGIKGKSDGVNGVGVYGESMSGKGVVGYSNNAGSIAVHGNSLAGTGVKATSLGGTALDVDGNVNISGGNTNPSEGAVLTSDANGNATWKNQKVGFIATSSVDQSIAFSQEIKMSLNEEYDGSGNFNSSAAATDPSTFIAPVDGLYHFSAGCRLWLSSVITNLTSGSVSFYVNGNYIGGMGDQDAYTSAAYSTMHLIAVRDIHLNAGDKVTVKAGQNNPSSLTATVDGKYFSGHLIYAD